ncbi:MAG: STAS domain-containing protein [Aphanothece sp. CMT-3BRIN-NPC111]|jgi:anti-anti-sigma factor|nr:STAS domain-containing protein [Aphanothece sp. CMT-3BRIN-NPC111]
MNSVVKVVYPSGILGREISDVITSASDTVLMDFQNVTFIDNSGFLALLSLLKRTRAAGGKLYLCSINAQVKMVLELTSLDRVIEIFANREEFNKAIMSQASKPVATENGAGRIKRDEYVNCQPSLGYSF